MAHLSHLHCWGENIDILYCSYSSASQGHWHGWVSITNPAVTLYFLFLHSGNHLSASLSLYYFPVSFLSFPHFSVSLSVLLNLTFLHLGCISGNSERTDSRGNKGVSRCHGKLRESRASNADLNSQLIFFHFLSLFLPKNFKQLWEKQGSGCLVNIRGHLEILEHQPSLKVCQSLWYDWKSVEGKTWWDFYAAVSHTFHT